MGTVWLSLLGGYVLFRAFPLDLLFWIVSTGLGFPGFSLGILCLLSLEVVLRYWIRYIPCLHYSVVLGLPFFKLLVLGY